MLGARAKMGKELEIPGPSSFQLWLASYNSGFIDEPKVHQFSKPRRPCWMGFSSEAYPLISVPLTFDSSFHRITQT